MEEEINTIIDEVINNNINDTLILHNTNQLIFNDTDTDNNNNNQHTLSDEHNISYTSINDNNSINDPVTNIFLNESLILEKNAELINPIENTLLLNEESITLCVPNIPKKIPRTATSYEESIVEKTLSYEQVIQDPYKVSIPDCKKLIKISHSKTFIFNFADLFKEEINNPNTTKIWKIIPPDYFVANSTISLNENIIPRLSDLCIINNEINQEKCRIDIENDRNISRRLLQCLISDYMGAIANQLGMTYGNPPRAVTQLKHINQLIKETETEDYVSLSKNIQLIYYTSFKLYKDWAKDIEQCCLYYCGWIYDHEKLRRKGCKIHCLQRLATDVINNYRKNLKAKGMRNQTFIISNVNNKFIKLNNNNCVDLSNMNNTSKLTNIEKCIKIYTKEERELIKNKNKVKELKKRKIFEMEVDNDILNKRIFTEKLMIDEKRKNLELMEEIAKLKMMIEIKDKDREQEININNSNIGKKILESDKYKLRNESIKNKRNLKKKIVIKKKIMEESDLGSDDSSTVSLDDMEDENVYHVKENEEKILEYELDKNKNHLTNDPKKRVSSHYIVKIHNHYKYKDEIGYTLAEWNCGEYEFSEIDKHYEDGKEEVEKYLIENKLTLLLMGYNIPISSNTELDHVKPISSNKNLCKVNLKENQLLEENNNVEESSTGDMRRLDDEMLHNINMDNDDTNIIILDKKLELNNSNETNSNETKIEESLNILNEQYKTKQVIEILEYTQDECNLNHNDLINLMIRENPKYCSEVSGKLYNVNCFLCNIKFVENYENEKISKL